MSKTSLALHSSDLSDSHTFLEPTPHTCRKWFRCGGTTARGHQMAPARTQALTGHMRAQVQTVWLPSLAMAEVQPALAPPVQPMGSELQPFPRRGYLTGLQDHQLLHPYTSPRSKQGISSAPFPPREFLHLGRNSFKMPQQLGFTKAVTGQSSLGFQGSLSPRGQEASKTSSYIFKTTWGFTCLLAVKTNTGLKPKAGSCKHWWGCDNSSCRSECCQSRDQPQPHHPQLLPFQPCSCYCTSSLGTEKNSVFKRHLVAANNWIKLCSFIFNIS